LAGRAEVQFPPGRPADPEDSREQASCGRLMPGTGFSPGAEGRGRRRASRHRPEATRQPVAPARPGGPSGSGSGRRLTIRSVSKYLHRETPSETGGSTRMGLLDGRAAVVTGGGRGIGRGHCLHLAQQVAAGLP
jgi:hypothetical protein